MRLEEALIRFWDSILWNLATGVGNFNTSYVYLMSGYERMGEIYGHSREVLDFRAHQDLLNCEAPDEWLLGHEHFIARVFENKLVGLRLPFGPANFDINAHDPNRMWLVGDSQRICGRLYEKPLRPDKPLENLALQSTRHVLARSPAPTDVSYELPDQLPTNGPRQITESDLARLQNAQRWENLAAAAYNARDPERLELAAANSPQPCVQSWYALSRIVQLPNFLDHYTLVERSRQNWRVLESLAECDADNGYAGILRTVCHLRTGLERRALSELRGAMRQPRVDFYQREMFASLFETANWLDWPPPAARHLSLGGSSLLILLFRFLSEGFQDPRARASLRRLAETQLEQPLMMQQMVGLALLLKWDPKNRRGVRLRERIRQNREFIQAVVDDQVSEQRWAHYFNDTSQCENTAIENLRAEGVIPRGHPDDWLKSVMTSNASPDNEKP